MFNERVTLAKLLIVRISLLTKIAMLYKEGDVAKESTDCNSLELPCTTRG